MDQWNRTENPEIDPCIYGQLIFKRMAKVISWGKIVWIQLDIYLEKMNIDPYLTSYTKINLKWIIELKRKLKLLKKTEEKIFMILG